MIEDLRFRLAGPSDADAIAALHADSWRRHYRGVYSDAFLDGDVDADRLAVWSQRLRHFDDSTHTVLAESGSGLVAFAHTVFDDDRTWGALLDNLHVTHSHKRQGVGSELLARPARALVERKTGLYLWVLEQNAEARAFYEARGGRFVERALASPPGGAAAGLNGSAVKLRCAWPDPALLLKPSHAAGPLGLPRRAATTARQGAPLNRRRPCSCRASARLQWC
jgi:GNAT superfamily N-acetyltransferase